MKALLLLSVAFGFSLDGFASSFQPPSPREIQTAIDTFQFRGKWIHPKIIGEFMPLESDHTLPLVVSVDVGAATGTNRFFGDVTLKAGPDQPECASGTGEWIRYRWIGKLKNGMHVLEVFESGGGTLVATSLAVFALRESAATDENGARYPQILLEVERIVNLGDRAIPTVHLAGNKVEVSTEFHSGRKPEKKVISFP